MNIHSHSGFKKVEDSSIYEKWVERVEKQNSIRYERLSLTTTLGKTTVYVRPSDAQESLVIFPGFRTSSLFWDLDNGLAELAKHFRIYLVETNGQPNTSEGNTPKIKSLEYGEWALEVLKGLGLSKTHVAGASFGGTVALKLASVAPEFINKVILLNPGCLQNFSLKWKNLWLNMLPILSPKRANIVRFLNEIVLCPPTQTLSNEAFELLVEYQEMALKLWSDKAQKPYGFSIEELQKVKSDVYLLEGENDLLFPYQKSIEQAKAGLIGLKDVKVLASAGHGIECSKKSMNQILSWLHPN